MRSNTAGELTAINATNRKTYFRVQVADAVGAMQDMHSLGGYNFVRSVSIDEDIDSPVATARVTFYRQQDVTGSVVSLSPLRTDSAVALLGPAVTVARNITIDIAVVTGSRPSALSTDWKRKFTGVIDSVSFASFDVIADCRDEGSHLVDQLVDPRIGNLVGNDPGETLEDAMNMLLLYLQAPALSDPVTVYVPTDPAYVVKSFPLRSEPIMDAAIRMAQLRGCDFRYYWNDTDGEYQPTLIVPERSSPVAAATIDPNQYVGVKQISIDRLAVRNEVNVDYRAKYAPNQPRRTVTVADNASILLYLRRAITIQEDDESAIDSEEEATDLAEFVLSDLKDPKAALEIEMLPDWRIELHDYLEFSPNQYFDIAQEWAVVGIRHEWDADKQRTYLRVRGTPAAAYVRWLKRAREIGPFHEYTEAENGLSQINYTDSTDGSTRTYTWERGINVAFVAFYEALVASPVTTQAFPSSATIMSLPGSLVLPTTTDTYIATRPAYGASRVAVAVPFYKMGGKYAAGQAVKFQLDGVGAPIPQGTVGIGSDGAVTFSVDGPDGTASFRYSTSTSAFPNEATVAVSGTIINGSTTGEVTPGVTLSFGQAVYITIVPFTGVNATGNQLPGGRLTSRFSTFTATKTTTYSGATWKLDPGASDQDDYFAGAFPANGDLTPVGVGPPRFQYLTAHPVLPDGVTVTSVAFEANDSAGPDFVTASLEVFFDRLSGTTQTNLGSDAAASGGGWQTLTLALSESTTGRTYVAVAVFDGATSTTTGGELKLGAIAITYTVPDPKRSV